MERSMDRSDAKTVSTPSNDHPIASPEVSYKLQFAALSLIWGVLNLKLLIGKRILPWDAIDEFYPTVYFNAHTLRLGLAPWWNPYIYSGYPEIADPQGMMFSPLLMAWMLLRRTPGATWFAWGVLLHLLMGGAAILGLLRRSSANAFGSLIGATVFMAGGVAASRLEHTPCVIAYAYAPVALLALRRFMTSPSVGNSLLLGLAAGALATQLVQVSYLMILMIFGYAVIAMTMHWCRYSITSRWQLMRGSVIASLLALMLGLPQLIFSWAYISLSNRSMMPLGDAATASLDARSFLTLLSPNVLHALRGNYTGPASIVEAYFYIGAIPSLLLIGIGEIWHDVAQRRQLLFFSAVALLACMYMFGLHTFFYGWLYTWLPGMSHFRRPADAAYLLNFSLAIISGLAASHFDLRSSRNTNILLATAVIWLTAASIQMRDHGVKWQESSLAAAVSAACALWFLRKSNKAHHTAACLLIVLIADYMCFNLNGTFNNTSDAASSFVEDPATNYLQTHLARENDLPMRIEPVDARTRWDNLVVLKGFASTQGYNPLRYGLYDRWYGARDNGNLPRINTAYNQTPNSALSNLLGMTYLVVGRPDNGRASFKPPSDFKKVFYDSQIEIWQNPHAYARILNPRRAQLLTSVEMLNAAEFATTSFNDTLWLTPRDKDDEKLDRAEVETCSGKLTVHGVEADPSQITLHSQSSHAGWLVLSELDFPGWQADADDAPLPIHRANAIFSAVCVPAGEHVVRFSFNPWVMVAENWRKMRF